MLCNYSSFFITSIVDLITLLSTFAAGKNVRCDLSVLGDAKRVLELVNERLPQQSHLVWKEFVFSFPTETQYEGGGDHLTPKQVNSTIARMCPNDTHSFRQVLCLHLIP